MYRKAKRKTNLPAKKIHYWKVSSTLVSVIVWKFIYDCILTTGSGRILARDEFMLYKYKKLPQSNLQSINLHPSREVKKVNLEINGKVFFFACHLSALLQGDGNFLEFVSFLSLREEKECKANNGFYTRPIPTYFIHK